MVEKSTISVAVSMFVSVERFGCTTNELPNELQRTCERVEHWTMIDLIETHEKPWPIPEIASPGAGAMDSGGIHHCSGLEQRTDRDRSVEAGTKFTSCLTKFLYQVVMICNDRFLSRTYLSQCQ